ncbi:MAG: nucleotidyltransferase family protein [Acidobacteriota bacterium]|nr:nucleotidyltransferase family protein [Acidobacteriota bacterium]
MTNETVITDVFRWSHLNNRKFEVRIAEAFRYLRESGIEPILIKGWAAARFYPPTVPRYFSDIDLAVSPTDYKSASALLESGAKKKIIVDLHKGVRHLDTLPWNDLFENSHLVDIDGVGIRILRPEDHLRILCVHWLGDGGANKDRLWDIYYAVSNRPESFDWDRCLNTVSDRRKKWIILTIGLAHKYLDLYIDDLPFAAEAKIFPLWLIPALEYEWNSGVPLMSLHVCLSDRRMLWKQIKKRIPPNPVQATIDVEGEFDEKNRLIYQAGSIIKRTLPSIKRIFNVFEPKK